MVTKFVFFAALILFLLFESEGASLGSNPCEDVDCYFYSHCDPTTLQCICPTCKEEINKVCASDGQIYLNLCSMKQSSCQQQKLITEARRGTCRGQDKYGDESKIEAESFDDKMDSNTELLDEADLAEELPKKELQAPDYVMENKEDVYKEPADMDTKLDEKVEIVPPDSDGERLYLSPDTARDVIQAEINRLALKYNEQLPGIYLLTLPPVEYLEMYSEVELAGDILCILRQIEIIIPPVQVALNEFLARYGAEIGVAKLEDFEITSLGSGSGEGSGSVQLSDCPDVKAPPNADKLEMIDPQGAAMAELAYFVETLLLSEINLHQQIKAKYA
uniref:Toxin candidate TRINITY_DN7714_c0_g2_i1 n=1 Tax=Ceriantheomorphe brasiliensis TaxID=1048506 RepID=A0A7G7WZ69_9CNID|nr:toxin candidate TRINITY_DN7714_c0_g2_i1 [Ceriantheomorphe brasiliensis]QNH72558.1 toxin candidate TRINITY_DN7714_c0_g2_i1 [Ceriantheomorphe brasiliensis]